VNYLEIILTQPQLPANDPASVRILQCRFETFVIGINQNRVSIFVDKPSGFFQASDNGQGFSLRGVVSGFGIQKLLRDKLDNSHRSDHLWRHNHSHRMIRQLK